jgi:hypothetical protein
MATAIASVERHGLLAIPDAVSSEAIGRTDEEAMMGNRRKKPDNDPVRTPIAFLLVLDITLVLLLLLKIT